MLITDLCSDYIFTVDSNFFIKDWNQRMTEIVHKNCVGVKFEEILSHSNLEDRDRALRVVHKQLAVTGVNITLITEIKNVSVTLTADVTPRFMEVGNDRIFLDLVFVAPAYTLIRQSAAGSSTGSLHRLSISNSSVSNETKTDYMLEKKGDTFHNQLKHFNFVLIDKSKRIVTASDTFCTLTSLTMYDMGMKKLSRLLFEKESARQYDVHVSRAMEKRLQKGYIKLTVAEKLVKLGAPEELIMYAMPQYLHDDDDTIVGVLLLFAELDASSNSASLSRFFAFTAHKLGNPMHAIFSSLQLMLSSDNMEPKFREYCKSMLSNIALMRTIMNDILDYSMIESGKLEFAQNPFVLRDVIDFLVKDECKKEDNKNISITFDIADDVPSSIVGSSVRYSQVLMHVLDNACKYTSSGGKVLVQVTCKHMLEPEDLYLIQTQVKDTGCGIPNNKIRHIFNVFSPHRESFVDSQGLGLPMCKKIVEYMGGEMFLESSEEGTNLYFTILVPAHNAAPETNSPQPLHAEFKQKSNLNLLQSAIKKKKNSLSTDEFPEVLKVETKIKVLLVEDNKVCQLMGYRILQNLGYKTDVALNGLQAVNAVKAAPTKYDVILMDLNMPIMGGLESSEKIRGLGYDGPIIGITANSSASDLDDCIKHGMNGLKQKPFDFKRLAKLLEETKNAMNTCIHDVPAPMHIHEDMRIKLLRSFHVLDTTEEKNFNDIVNILKTVCRVPMAVISLVDSDRQFFKAKVGLDALETPRDMAFCAHAIVRPPEEMITVFEIPDATLDPRFKHNSLVVGAPYVKFYAGAPLIGESDLPLGTVCVLDIKPRRLTNEQTLVLQMMSKMVMVELEKRRERKSVLYPCIDQNSMNN